jgi:superfamily I DNA/RNA helicase
MMQTQVLARFSETYLLEEINSVIAGRQLQTLEEYLQAHRPGRKVPLNASQRKVIWQVHLAFREVLAAARKTTFPYARDLAEQISREYAGVGRYDAVVIDEAQDLDPSVLRILTRLCPATNRLFITADANQSIYGSGFNWSDVHADLRFQGRTGLLKANYRSTREIGEAAQSYLAAGTLDDEPVDRVYINNGPPPAARVVKNNTDEAALLGGFLKKAARDFRLGLAACAVLCPSENAGRALAARLKGAGVQANFMSGKELDLSCPGVKILTLKSSKGLEFPIVALSGFFDSFYPVIPTQATPEETAEINNRERRTMFVGMTRAMRALLVIVPVQTSSDLLTGFDGNLWNLGKTYESQNYL